MADTALYRLIHEYLTYQQQLEAAVVIYRGISQAAVSNAHGLGRELESLKRQNQALRDELRRYLELQVSA